MLDHTKRGWIKHGSSMDQAGSGLDQARITPNAARGEQEHPALARGVPHGRASRGRGFGLLATRRAVGHARVRVPRVLNLAGCWKGAQRERLSWDPRLTAGVRAGNSRGEGRPSHREVRTGRQPG